MRKLKFMFLLGLFGMMSIGASAYDFSAKNADGVAIYYNITSSTDLTCEVTYRNFLDNSYSGNVSIPASVSYSGKTYSVTSIGSYAFYGCTGLTSMTIGNSVTIIGEEAFSGCTGLTSIEIPNSVTRIGSSAFENCSGLKSITIPVSVTSIGERAFYNCTSLPVENNLRYADTYLAGAVDKTLSTYIIKEGTKWIGSSAFDGCKSLPSVTIPNSVTSIGGSAFRDCTSLTSVTIPNSVTSIGYEAFYQCYGLTSVTIPNSVTSIGGSAFSGCSGLTSVTIPNSVTSIEKYAFERCTGLTSITIPNSVTSIGYSAFEGCSGLTSVTIPNSVTSVGERAFYNCTSLTAVHITDIDKWAEVKFYDYNANPLCCAHNLYLNGTLVTDAKLTTAITISSYAFYNCTSLTSIEIPNSVTSIGKSAFYGCGNVKELIYAEGTKTVLRSGINSITSVTIPNSVTSIGYDAFYNCTSLTAVHITDIDKWAEVKFYDYNANPLCYAHNLYLNGTLVTDAKLTSAKKIGSYAFYNCIGLTSIELPNTVTSVGYDAFYGCTSLTAVHITDIDKWAEIEFGSSPANPLSYAKKLYLNGELVTDARLISATSIGNYAFSGYTGLTSIEIPNSVTSIGERAFYECKKLSNVKMGNAVESIGNYAFSECSDLESIVLPDVLKRIGYYAFANTCLTSIDIPNSVTHVGSYTFENCKVLSSVKIGKSVERIEEYAFHGCLCMDSIDIPHGVIAIGYNAFYECQSLKKVKIPSSVQKIDSYAFNKCPNLEDVYVCWNKPITIAGSVFDKTNGYILSTLWVPIGRINFYKVADHWGKFVEIKEWDASTGIEEIKSQSTVNGQQSMDLYNLQGLKIGGQPYRGIVIKNGKKYVVK